MIYISGKTAELVAVGDMIIILFALLFRKPKPKIAIPTLDRKSIVRLGYYLMAMSVIVLVMSPFIASFRSYVCYFAGLSLLSLMFFAGMVMLRV